MNFLGMMCLGLICVGDDESFIRRFIYYPAGPRVGLWACPPGGEEVRLKTRDGVTLVGWWAPAEGASRTILFLHGNGGNITHRRPALELLRSMGYSVLLMDYRGFGRSEGRPTEKGLYEDAWTAVRHLAEDRGIDSKRLILFGESLGTAVAVELASKETFAGVILQSPFTSLPELVRVMISGGIAAMLPDKYDSIGKIAGMAEPLLILHGNLDGLVPVEHGRRLFEAAEGSKQLKILEGAGHNDVLIRVEGEWKEAIQTFVTEL